MANAAPTACPGISATVSPACSPIIGPLLDPLRPVVAIPSSAKGWAAHCLTEGAKPPNPKTGESGVSALSVSPIAGVTAAGDWSGASGLRRAAICRTSSKSSAGVNPANRTVSNRCT